MRGRARSGGPETALAWVADGLRGDWVDRMEGSQATALRRQLEDSGLDEAAVERMMRASELKDGDERGPAVEAPATRGATWSRDGRACAASPVATGRSWCKAIWSRRRRRCSARPFGRAQVARGARLR